MSEEVEIEVLLSSKMHANAPSFQLFIDDILIEEGKIFEKQIDNEHKVINWKGDLAEGDHVIRIKYFNKTNADTIIDNVSKEILPNDAEALIITLRMDIGSLFTLTFSITST